MPQPESFQHFQVLRRDDGALWELGRGAMGVTYKAFDTNLRSHVALKVINAQHLDSDTSRQRFLREARAAAGMRHPNVAAVFHLGESGGDYFYAMEFIDGETVEDCVRKRGPLPAALALRVTLQVARALRAAEKVGLVHRDIKPANLMLVHDDGDEGVDPHLKVIDFGLAKAVEKGVDTTTITMGGFVGTPHFASPEQLEEHDLDARSDIYSLGVTLWFMLTGKPPFSGTMARIMSQHLGASPPFEQLADQPPAVVSLLRRILQKDPARRQQNASELRREIEQCLGEIGASTSPATSSGRYVPPMPDTVSPPLPPPTFAPTAATAAPVGPPSVPRPPKGSGTPILAGIGVALAILAAAGAYLGYRYAADRFDPSKPVRRAQPVVSATPSPTAPPKIFAPPLTPLPVPVATPTATIAAVTPSLPPPTPDRVARYQEILADVQRLEADGRAGEAIDGYVRLLEDYPENTQTAARLDSLVVRLDKDDASLRAPLERAARTGAGGAMLALGDRLVDTDPTAAGEWYRQAASRGRVEAMITLGDLSYRGLGVPVDATQAARWYGLASEKGSAKAKVYLAEFYQNGGGGLPRDPGRMFALLKEADAIEPDNPATREKLALAYEHGWGTPADPRRAFELMKGAADAGLANALANVGSYYMRGFGTKADPKAAVAIFRAGAEQNNAACQFFYAQCLEHGLGGVSANTGAAADLYRRAAAHGFPPARQWCAQHRVAFTPD